MPKQINRKEIPVEPWTDFGKDLAELIGEYVEEQGPTSYIQRVSGATGEDIEVTTVVHDHTEFLSDLGDLVSEHYPDEVSDRSKFSVRWFDVSMDGESTVEILIDRQAGAE